MFDIGFLELFVVMVIALMVIGPDRMPEVALKLGRLLGKTKHFINSMKENSGVSSAIQEIKETINLEEEKQQIQKITSTVEEDISNVQQELSIDENISRPTFGSEEAPVNTSSQFNKAPSQPVMPKNSESKDETTETAVATKTEETKQNLSSTPEAKTVKT
jgi:sec-independent protein translocase protein TatB